MQKPNEFPWVSDVQLEAMRDVLFDTVQECIAFDNPTRQVHDAIITELDRIIKERKDYATYCEGTRE